jgi:hypothetical protein
MFMWRGREGKVVVADDGQSMEVLLEVRLSPLVSMHAL